MRVNLVNPRQKKHAFQGVFNRKGLRVECWLWNRPWSGAYGLLRYVLLQGRLCFFFAVNLNLTRISWLWNWVNMHALLTVSCLFVCQTRGSKRFHGDALFEEQQEKERQLRLRRSAEGSRGSCRASFQEHHVHNVCPPSDVCWFINPILTLV